jgi:hypothetical protein
MLENGQLDDAMAGIDALQLRPVNPRGFGAAEEGKIMAVATPLAVSMTVTCPTPRCSSRQDQMAIHPPKPIKATLAAVSMKWPNLPATATPANQITEAIISVDTTWPMPA